MYLKYDHPELIKQVFDDVAKGDIENLRFYLMDGVDPDMRNAEGNSLLHVATRHGHEDCVQMLLDFGAEPTQKGTKPPAAPKAATETVDAEKLRKDRVQNDLAELRAQRPLKRLGPSR